MNLGIEGRRALITGGAGGLGRAAAGYLQADGVEVVLTDLAQDDLDAAADALGGVPAYAADLTDEAAVGDLRARIERDHGGIDILVSNAGVTGAKGHPLEMEDTDWHEAWSTDFMSAVRVMRAFVPGMADRGWGRVVAVVSENAVQPYWDEAVYNTAKAALLNFCRGLSRQYPRHGVLVNTVAPAFIETPMTDFMMDKRAEELGVSQKEAIESFLAEERPYLALERRGKPEEVGAVIAFLCSELASFVNGASWRVDGGAVATMAV
jgi:NAD(P)-dependent dehydrogenase (short-subunit alcohol dehydrogenase family)